MTPGYQLSSSATSGVNSRARFNTGAQAGNTDNSLLVIAAIVLAVIWMKK